MNTTNNSNTCLLPQSKASKAKKQTKSSAQRKSDCEISTTPFPINEIFEVRRTIANNPGYQISDLGNVYSKNRVVNYIKDGKPRSRKLKGKKLKARPDSSGYPQVNLNGKFRSVHILVYQTFVDPTFKPRQGFQVDHIRENQKTDPSLSNLQLLSARENKSKSCANKTGYNGVCHNPVGVGYIAKARIGDKHHTIGGIHHTAKHAALARHEFLVENDPVYADRVEPGNRVLNKDTGVIYQIDPETRVFSQDELDASRERALQVRMALLRAEYNELEPTLSDVEKAALNDGEGA